MSKKIHDIEPMPLEIQNVVLAALEFYDTDWEESLAELERLAETANGKVTAVITQKREKPDVATYFGKGKIEEIKELMVRTDAEILIIDGEISPSQQRNIQKAIDVQVIDRTGLILDIFARRAHTAEGKLQVELAQLEYLLPRLANMWSHLERIRGGIGLRGPGETQIETDRRLVRDKISMLEKKVDEIKHRRRIQRNQRAQSQIPLVSLVGYTNSGKSTLLNALSQAGVFVEDKLFATLDPTTRDVTFPNGARALVSDTVGFIRNLPTQLVAAFRATLEETTNADILIHVIDAANVNWMEQVETVDKILNDLESIDKPMLMTFNKVDIVDDLELLHNLASRYPNKVFIAAGKGEGLHELGDAIMNMLRASWVDINDEIPMKSSILSAELHGRGEVIEIEYRENSIYLRGRAPADLASRIKASSI
jgi:GTP-binding protein HflX